MVKKICLSIIALCLLGLCGCSSKDAPVEMTKSNQPKSNQPKSNQPKSSSTISLNTKCNGWGMGKDLDEKNCPISCVDFQAKYQKLGAYFYNPPKQEGAQKTITLTFDNGYENGFTEKILDT